MKNSICKTGLNLAGYFRKTVCIWILALGFYPAPVMTMAVAATSPVAEVGAINASPSPIFAEATLEGAVTKFYDFLKTILNVVALCLVIWGGLKFSEGHVREGIFALTGAFVVLIARIIVQELAKLGT